MSCLCYNELQQQQQHKSAAAQCNEPMRQSVARRREAQLDSLQLATSRRPLGKGYATLSYCPRRNAFCVFSSNLKNTS